MVVEIASGYIGSLVRPSGVVSRGAHVRSQVRPEASSPVGLSRDYQAVLAAGRIKGEIAALASGKATAERGIKFAKAATTGLDEIKANLDRMELIAKASYSTTQVKDTAGNVILLADSDQERAIYQAEFDKLRTEIDEIVDRTKFNDTKLLDGGGGASQSFSFRVGGGTADATGNDITISVKSLYVADLDASLASADITTTAGATAAETVVKDAKGTLDDARGTILGAQRRFDSAVRNADVRGSFLADEVDSRLEFYAIEDKALVISTNVARGNGITLDGFEVRAEGAANSTFQASAPGVFTGADKPAAAIEIIAKPAAAKVVGQDESASVERAVAASYGSHAGTSTSTTSASSNSSPSVDIEA